MPLSGSYHKATNEEAEKDVEKWDGSLPPCKASHTTKMQTFIGEENFVPFPSALV